MGSTIYALRAALLPLACVISLADATARGQAPPETAGVRLKQPVLGLGSAVHYALENNPALAAQRQQHGIAAAKIVIADTYPFNPVLENRIQAASGPTTAGITNGVPLEHLLLWEVELRHQKRYRQQGAAAVLSRTDWEIAFQEQTLAVQVVRAYLGLLYRQEKLRLLEETLRFNEQLVVAVRRLSDNGKLKSADFIVAQSEVTDTLDQVAAGRETLSTARQDLYRVLGVLDGAFEIEGSLEAGLPAWDANSLGDLAVSRRADLHARQMAVAEACANVRLAVANRFGNPIVGPAYTYDPARVSQIGVQINIPLPLLNTKRGEIYQSEAEHAQAQLLLRQAEVNVRQDVTAALARLEAAQNRAELFRTRALPDLRKAVTDMETLLDSGREGVDLLKVIDIRRKLLKARDGYLDALWSVRQAQADVLAATGEPTLALCNPEPAPAAPQP